MGYSGMAAALTDRRGRCHGALGMAVASASWSRAEIEARLLPSLQATAAAIRAVL